MTRQHALRDFTRTHRSALYAIGWGVFICFFLISSVWQQPGMIDYVDMNLPHDLAATITSLGRFSAAWDWYANMGRPNASFLSEQTLLVPYLVLQLLFGPDPASKMLLFMMVLSSYVGALFAMRRLRRQWFGAVVGATFFIVNPWYFDEIAQGHIYLLMSAWVVPLIFALFVQPVRWSSRDSILALVTVTYVVAVDFRFAALLYFIAVVGLFTRLRAVRLREILWRSLPLVVAPLLLAFIALPYIGMLAALRAGNAPVASSLGYYSAFTSIWASLSLVRPNYDAVAQLVHLGDRLTDLWSASYVVLFALALRSFARVEDRGFKIAVLVVAGVGIVLGSGENSPFGGLNDALHRDVPLYGDLFRDPSKFYILQVVAYAFLLSALRMPSWPYRYVGDLTAEPLERLVAHTAKPALLACAAVLYLVPFLAWTFATVSAFDPSQNPVAVAAVDRAEADARAKHARFTMFPPGVRVQYAGSPSFVYDPFILFPTAPDVRIPVAYDFEPASLAVRWALATIDEGRTDVAGSLLDELGVSSVAVRDVPGQYDLPIENSMLPALAKPPFSHQRDLTDDGGGVFHAQGGIATGSDAIVLVDGDRATMSTARSLGVLPESTIWCFVGQCRPSGSSLAVSNVSVAPLGVDLDIQHFGFADYGGHWIAGTIAWAEDELNAGRTPVPSLVGFGAITGSASFDVPRRDADVWMQVANSSTASEYRLDGLGSQLRLNVPQSLGSNGFAWYRLGRAHASAQRVSLTLAGTGAILCVGAIRLTAPGAAPSLAAVYVGHLANARIWSIGHAYLERVDDGSADGFRVNFGGRSPSRLVLETSVPDGWWTLVVHGRRSHSPARVRARSASTCALAFGTRDATSSCRILMRGGRLEIETARGSLHADAYALWRPDLVAAIPVAAKPLPFAHTGAAFSVSTGGRFRYVAVKIADPGLWASSATALGTAYDYALLFERGSAERLTGRFKPDAAFGPGVAMAACAALGFGMLVWRRERRAVGADRR